MLVVKDTDGLQYSIPQDPCFGHRAVKLKHQKFKEVWSFNSKEQEVFAIIFMQPLNSIKDMTILSSVNSIFDLIFHLTNQFKVFMIFI